MRLPSIAKVIVLVFLNVRVNNPSISILNPTFINPLRCKSVTPHTLPPLPAKGNLGAKSDFTHTLLKLQVDRGRSNHKMRYFFILGETCDPQVFAMVGHS